MHPKDTTTPLLLILYEFEAKAKLGDSDLEEILERTLLLPYAEAKAFETIAGVNPTVIYIVITLQWRIRDFSWERAQKNS